VRVEPLRNWAGNRVYAGTLVRPGSLDEAADVVARSRHVRALGSRHGFNDAADSQGALVSLDRLAYRHTGDDGGPAPELDPATGHVRVPAATTYADLARFLAEHDRTLPNYASLPHITVAGAVVTATHGSGTGNPVLAASVVGLDLLLADGTERRLDREADGDVLDGATVSLGALGLVHGVTLATVPAFDVAQTVYGPLPLAGLVEAFDEVSDLGYSVSCFTTLRGPDVETVWVKQVAGEDAPPDVLGAPALTSAVHPIPGVDPANCTPQGGVPGPAADRLPHFRAEGMPSAGAEIQCEYLVPREEARAALRALAGLAGPLAGLLQVCEVRSVAPDRAWLSPMRDQPCVAVHFTLVRDVERVAAVLPLLEETFGPLGGRPHWGKETAADPARVRALYPRRADFLDLARTLDPGRKFSNAFVRRWVG